MNPSCFYHWYEGFSAPETADLSGYGVRHVLRVNGDTVLSDHYNEGSATGVAAAGRLDDERYTQYAGAESQAEKKTAPVITADTGTAAFPDGFDPSRAIAYADRFALGRNRSRYPDLHTLGGDCANFVSQCLQAGGLPFAGDWYWEGGAAGSGGRAFKAATWLYRHLTADVRCGQARGDDRGQGSDWPHRRLCRSDPLRRVAVLRRLSGVLPLFGRICRRR